MPLGTEVGLGPGHTVLDEKPPLPEMQAGIVTIIPYIILAMFKN